MKSLANTKEMEMYYFDADLVSDLHKDAYGFRPSAYWWEIWNESTDDQKQGTWDDLLRTIDESIALERAVEAAAVETFEKEIADAIKMGAADRSAAIRWLVSAFEYGDYYSAYDKAETFREYYHLPWTMVPEIAECLQ